MEKQIVVAVGSQNNPKLCAVQRVFNRVLNRPVRVVGMNTDSGVPEQPWDDDIATGALNRCLVARTNYPGADYFVGIEAGIHNDLLPPDMTCIEIAYVGSKNTTMNTGGMSGGFVIPPEMEDLVTLGALSMGDAADKVYGTKNLGAEGGLVSQITDNMVRRQDYITPAVLFALSSHLKRYPDE